MSRALMTPDEFFARANKHGPVPPHRPDIGACWEWTGAKVNDGYGLVSRGGRTLLAHRLAWMMATGTMPERRLLHACDNPACVRVSHLREGTQAENMADRRERRRGGDSQRRLSDEQRAEVLRLRATGARVIDIARLVGFSRPTVDRLLAAARRAS